MTTMPSPALTARSSGFRPGYDRPPTTADRAQRLTRAFDTAQRDGDDRSLRELRAATFGFVTWLKAANLPPERALVTLKSVLASDGQPLSLFAGNPYANTTPRHRIYRCVFGWSLDAYFGPTSDRITPQLAH